MQITFELILFFRKPTKANRRVIVTFTILVLSLTGDFKFLILDGRILS